MHNILNDVDAMNNHKTDLKEEYNKSLKNKDFKNFVKKINVDERILMQYTSLLEESSCEYKNCCNCKSLFECKNKMEGFAYLPRINGESLIFEYKPCKYKNEMMNKNKFLKNIRYFNTPVELQEASIDNIYKTDKKRLSVM